MKPQTPDNKVSKPSLIKGKREMILTFTTPAFEINGTIYKIISTEKTETDVIHTVKNTTTGETKNITHKKLTSWFQVDKRNSEQD